MTETRFTPGEWEVGVHPGAPNAGYIVKPVLFGSRVHVFPECEGGHVALKSKDDANLIAASKELFAVAAEFDRLSLVVESSVRNWDQAHHSEILSLIKNSRAALFKSLGETI